MIHSFVSDYQCPPHRNVRDYLNRVHEMPIKGSYGDDEITHLAREEFKRHFGSEAVFFVSTGTAANQLALEVLLGGSYQAVLCAEDAHINTAECGALHSRGYGVVAVPTVNGKITWPAVEDLIMQAARMRPHAACPGALSISNTTENGNVYHKAELELLIRNAKQAGLGVHIDGARMANAAASHKKNSLGAISLDLGADAVTFGGTKNGGIDADAVVFAPHIDKHVPAYVQKQQGQLCARMYVRAAQFLALLENDLWLANAHNANNMARLLVRKLYEEFDGVAGVSMSLVESNAVMVEFPTKVARRVHEVTGCYIWKEGPIFATIRFMCSWNTTPDDVDKLIGILKDCMR